MNNHLIPHNQNKHLFNNMNILYIGQEYDFYDEYKDLFKSIVIFNNERDAFTYFYNNAVDILIVDSTTSLLNNAQIVKKFKDHSSKLPCIFLISSSDESGVMDLIGLGLNNVLLESKNNDKLLDEILNVYQNRCFHDKDIIFNQITSHRFYNEKKIADLKIMTNEVLEVERDFKNSKGRQNIVSELRKMFSFI